MNPMDRLNLDDLKSVMRELKEAEEALTKAMVGHGVKERDTFAWGVGFGLARLTRIRMRLNGEEDPNAP
jgi:hypothetical protein